MTIKLMLAESLFHASQFTGDEAVNAGIDSIYFVVTAKLIAVLQDGSGKQVGDAC